MHITIGQKANVHLFLFNGAVAYNRPAPLYRAVLLAAFERPGITRDELSELLAIPMPWVHRLCEPLIESGLISQVDGRIELTPSGAKMPNTLPVERREGDFLALVLEEPIDGHILLGCVSASDLRIGEDALDDMVEMPGLTGHSFESSGDVEVNITTKEEPRVHEMRGGSLLSILEGRVLEYGNVEGLIVTHDGASTFLIDKKKISHSRNVSLTISCTLPISIYHKNAEILAAEAFRIHNQERHLPEDARRKDCLLRTFASLSEDERRLGRGDYICSVDDITVCKLVDAPVYPKTPQDYQTWAAWRVRQRISRHLSKESFSQLADEESAKVPGHAEHGPFRIEALLSQLTPKQKMYMSAASDWQLSPQ